MGRLVRGWSEMGRLVRDGKAGPRWGGWSEMARLVRDGEAEAGPRWGGWSEIGRLVRDGEAGASWSLDLKESFFPVCAEIYTQRDVRLHVQRLKDLLSTSPLEQSMMSTDGLTLSFLTSITQLHPESPGRWSGGCILAQLHPESPGRWSGGCILAQLHPESPGRWSGGCILAQLHPESPGRWSGGCILAQLHPESPGRWSGGCILAQLHPESPGRWLVIEWAYTRDFQSLCNSKSERQCCCWYK